jgi:hypothetical protein
MYKRNANNNDEGAEGVDDSDETHLRKVEEPVPGVGEEAEVCVGCWYKCAGE